MITCENLERNPSDPKGRRSCDCFRSDALPLSYRSSVAILLWQFSCYNAGTKIVETGAILQKLGNRTSELSWAMNRSVLFFLIRWQVGGNVVSIQWRRSYPWTVCGRHPFRTLKFSITLQLWHSFFVSCHWTTLWPPFSSFNLSSTDENKREIWEILPKFINNSWRENKGNHHHEGGLDKWS